MTLIDSDGFNSSDLCFCKIRNKLLYYILVLRLVLTFITFYLLAVKYGVPQELVLKPILIILCHWENYILAKSNDTNSITED